MEDCTPYEFSSNFGKRPIAVHSSHDGVIKIWSVLENKLLTEYKPSSHLSATCSCLSWCPKYREDIEPKRKKRKRASQKRDLQELKLFAIGTASGTVLLYSVQKEDLHSLLAGGHTDKVNGIAWYPESNSLISCSDDQHIIQWDLKSTDLQHKWRGDDKGPINSLCKCSNQHLLSAGRSIKLWDITTRTELKRFTGHATEVFRLIHISNNSDSIENSYFLSAARNDRIINAWQISSSEKNALAAFSLPDEPLDMQISPSNDKSLVMVVVTKCGKALLYEHKLNGKLKKPLQPKITIEMGYQMKKKEVRQPIQILGAIAYNVYKHELVLVYGNHTSPSFERVKYDTSESEICLIREKPSQVKPQAKNVSKVKTPEVSKDMTLLVPAEMAPQLPTQEAAKKRKRKTSVGELTLEQRLNAVSLEKPESVQKEQPRANTLITLLIQGLNSRDKTLLNQVLSKTDQKLVQNTVRKVPVQMVIPLVQELTRRMHGLNTTGVALVIWIKSVLAVHTSYLMTFPEIIETFSSLYQMMDSRVAMLGKLSRLKGKLDIMLSQISAQTQEPDEEDLGIQQRALLLFEEESSDDDLQDLAIGPGVSDSEENWEDFSDEESDSSVEKEVNSKKSKKEDASDMDASDDSDDEEDDDQSDEESDMEMQEETNGKG